MSATTTGTTTNGGLSSKTRWTIAGLLSASLAINLLDRQVFSVLSPYLIETFNWTATQYAYAGIAFNLGMMIGQVPAGVFLDRVGTRAGLAVLFVAWTVLTALHALAGPGTVVDTIGGGLLSLVPGMPVLAAGLAGFILLRFVLGLSQCGNFTAGIKALAGLFPAASRSRAGGVFNAGAQFGSVMAYPVVFVVLFERLGASWQLIFIMASLVWLLWLPFWLKVFPSNDRMDAVAIKPVTGSATSAVPSVSLWQLLSNHKIIGFALIRVFTGPITVFYWTWLALYLRTGRGMTFLAIGLYGLLPNLFGVLGNLVGGHLTDSLVKFTGSVDRGRKLGFVGAFSLGALSMTLPFVGSDALALVVMGLALFGNQWVAATYIGTVGDLVPQDYAGRVNGIGGLADNGMAMIAVLFTGVLVDTYGWTPVFLGVGMFPILAMASLFLVLRRIEPAQFGPARA